MDPLKNPFMNDRLYTFGRMIFPTPQGDRFGVARIWYDLGHAYEGNCEAELIDGTSVLVPIKDVQVAPNWDETPEEGRFTGSEFFRPRFLEGLMSHDRLFFQRSHGVVLPSDLEAVRKLVATVEPGQTVQWYSHGSNEFRGDVTVDSVDDKGMTLKGGSKSQPTGLMWPTSSEPEIGPQYAEEFIVEGRKLRFFRVSPKRYGQGPSESLTLMFKRKG